MSSPRPSINFQAISTAALAVSRRLLSEWLPGGDWSGDEYKPRNPTRDDKHPGSFVINAKTGKWIDNATGDSGGDLISLYAYIHFVEQIEAAKAVAALVGIDVETDNNDRPAVKTQHKPAKYTETQQNGVKIQNNEIEHEHAKSPWVPIMPVSDDAPVPPVAHYVRGRPDVVYTYRAADGRVNGYVYRFTTSDGGKETMPVCFCRNRNNGKTDWRWMAFSDHSRPLYGLNLLDGYPDRPVLLVEGEKCADAGRDELAGHWVVLSWQGGTKAIHKTDWRPLVGRRVFAWADCDAKRRKLTREEKAAGVDPDSLPLLPEADQPGMRAMREIHKILLEFDSEIDFQFVDIPKPGERPDGWDIADAIAGGMDKDALMAFVANVRKQPSKPKEKGRANRMAGSAQKGDSSLQMKGGLVESCPMNVYRIISGHPDWNGVVRYNEFTYAIDKVKPPPFSGGDVGEWNDIDTIRAIVWINESYGFSPNDKHLIQGLELVADDNRYHPVREYLKSQEWDRTSRIDDWLTDYVGVEKTEYVRLVSRWFLIGMVARVMSPGIKFDCCLVLQGKQGRRKTELFKVLGGEWFGNTDLDFAHKDSMISLRGKWVYEIAELGSFTRSDSARQKSFLSREVDEFRPPYKAGMIQSPRQLVFGGTTNETGWNKDNTGGRRFWPIKCDHLIDCDGLAAVRDQLFAEAYFLYAQGDRFWPTSSEQDLIFKPIQDDIRYYNSNADRLMEWAELQTSPILLSDAFDHLKIPIDKQNKNAQMEFSDILQNEFGFIKDRRIINGKRAMWYFPPEKNIVNCESVAGEDNGIEF